MTAKFGVDKALQSRPRLIDSDPALIGIAEGQREPLPPDRRLPARLRGVRRNERRLRQQRLPGAADLDQIVAVGAVAVKKDDELPRPTGARCKSRTIKRYGHSPSAG